MPFALALAEHVCKCLGNATNPIHSLIYSSKVGPGPGSYGFGSPPYKEIPKANMGEELQKKYDI